MSLINILVDAIVISIILLGGVFLMIKINPRSQLHNYPPQIRDSVPPMTKADKRILLLVGIPIFLMIIGYIIISFYIRYQGTEVSYVTILAHWVIVYFAVCCIDLFIGDYGIFCTLTPKFIIIPGTEGNPAYKDKSYHTKTIPAMFLVIIVCSLLSSLVYFLT